MFAEIAEKRRSVRKFSDQQVEPEKIETILETALRAPSGRGARPWEFVVVSDRETLAKLSAARPGGAAFVKDAGFAVVVCGDPAVSALWVEDCSIAAVTMQYAAQSLGLGTRWAHMRDKDFSESKSSRNYIAELLGLPENLNVECIIAIGYPAEETVPYKREELKSEKIHYNSYGEKKE